MPACSQVLAHPNLSLHGWDGPLSHLLRLGGILGLWAFCLPGCVLCQTTGIDMPPCMGQELACAFFFLSSHPCVHILFCSHASVEKKSISSQHCIFVGHAFVAREDLHMTILGVHPSLASPPMLFAFSQSREEGLPVCETRQHFETGGLKTMWGSCLQETPACACPTTQQSSEGGGGHGMVAALYHHHTCPLSCLSFLYTTSP